MPELTEPGMAFPSPESFKQWLMSKPATETLTADWGSNCCPLAMFLAHQGSVAPWVSPETYRAGFWSDHHGFTGGPMPGWANAFAKAIDKLGRKRKTDAISGFGDVTSRDCLRVLKRVLRQG